MSTYYLILSSTQYLNVQYTHIIKLEHCKHNRTNMKTSHTDLRKRIKHYIIFKCTNITFYFMTMLKFNIII